MSRGVTHIPAPHGGTRALANRQRILDVAARELAANPRASIDEIAAGAGVVRRTIYGHFPTRDALIAGLIDQASEEIEAAVRSVRSDASPVIAAAQLLMAVWVVGARYRMLVRLDGPDWEPQIQRALAPVHRRGSEVIAAGQRDGLFADHLPPAVLAHVVEGMTQTLLENFNDGPDSARTAAQAVLIALGVPASRAESAARRAWADYGVTPDASTASDSR